MPFREMAHNLRQDQNRTPATARGGSLSPYVSNEMLGQQLDDYTSSNPGITRAQLYGALLDEYARRSANQMRDDLRRSSGGMAQIIPGKGDTGGPLRISPMDFNGDDGLGDLGIMDAYGIAEHNRQQGTGEQNPLAIFDQMYQNPGIVQNIGALDAALASLGGTVNPYRNTDQAPQPQPGRGFFSR